ncbi:MAG: hypothetical protein NZ932_03990 [Candidatus Bathyarchaeota archaeon]|nr:hypothetical protein [Candidatus Bathyarchaeota archaeon]MDW8022370.1 hypothetical protein [Nitrososphaerota archaeon]
MSIFKKRNDSAKCTLTGVREDGTRIYVCKIPEEGKIFKAEQDKKGDIRLITEMFVPTPEDYRRIHEAIKRQVESESFV